MAYPDTYNIIAQSLGVSTTTAIVILGIIGVWALVWKGFALWKSGRKGHLIWFIAILILNTIGILEILYIFLFSKMGEKNKITKVKSRPKKSSKKETKKNKKKK